MTEWTPEADHVDIYNKYPKASTDGFDKSDLGLTGFHINEGDFSDCV